MSYFEADNIAYIRFPIKNKPRPLDPIYSADKTTSFLNLFEPEKPERIFEEIPIKIKNQEKLIRHYDI
jgi:hypothetical protein